MKYYIEIVRYETDVIVKRIDCGESERKAEKVERGVNINLNHKDYYTRIAEEKDGGGK